MIFPANLGAAMNAGSGAINPSGVFDVLAVWAVGTAPTVYPEGTGCGKGELKKEVAAALAGNINFTIPRQARNYEMRRA